ncbi:MAG: threonine synthase [Candidatus Methanomethyliaceae archaeon]|nr:threonine synthase [Candidatus Methanomethyliaceae archaeon]MDW7971080.1 threonine synthase [Nitrososphaerota archaeon]
MYPKSRLKCINCGKEFGSDEIVYVCRNCNSLLEVLIDIPRISLKEMAKREFSVWRYREFIPIEEDCEVVTLREGGTPLYECNRLAKWVGVKKLYIKYEGANPTGSFKDRGMTVGVTKAKSLGSKAVACASTGNTSASLAAYAARAGLTCYVLLPAHKVALGKLAQALMHGAKVISVRGNFDVALKMVMELSQKMDIYILNSVNPWRLEGQKTLAFEIIDQLNHVPDVVCVPMGNCGNISAIWKGFKEFHISGIIDKTPKMFGVQAEGAAPLVNMLKRGDKVLTPVTHPETIATAIRIGNPVNWPKAVMAIKESNGFYEAVSDEEIIEAQRLIATLEGIGVEPASAASVAGLKKAIANNIISKDIEAVCVCTGHLLKDPEEVIKVCNRPIEITPDVKLTPEILLAK